MTIQNGGVQTEIISANNSADRKTDGGNLTNNSERFSSNVLLSVSKVAKSESRVVLVGDGEGDGCCSCSGMRIGDLGGVLLEAAKLTRSWFCQKPGYG